MIVLLIISVQRYYKNPILSRVWEKKLFKKTLEHFYALKMPHFGNMLIQEDEEDVEKDRPSCAIELELVHRVVVCVKEFAEPFRGILVQIICVIDVGLGKYSLHEVEAAAVLVFFGIDAEAELADQTAGENEMEVGPSGFALFENPQAAQDEIPETRIGFLFPHGMRDEFGHVEALRRLVRMGEGEHVGRLQDLGFTDLSDLLRGMSLDYDFEHRHRGHHRAQLTSPFASRCQWDTTRHTTEFLRVEMHELSVVVDGYCGEYYGLCLIGFLRHLGGYCAKVCKS